MRKYSFSLDFTIELPDLKENEEEHCCVGLGNAQGHCGGECHQYFFGIIKSWIDNTPTASVVFDRSEIERLDEDGWPIDPEFLAIKDKTFDELVAESSPVSDELFEWMEKATEGVTYTDEDFK